MAKDYKAAAIEVANKSSNLDDYRKGIIELSNEFNQQIDNTKLAKASSYFFRANPGAVLDLGNGYSIKKLDDRMDNGTGWAQFEVNTPYGSSTFENHGGNLAQNLRNTITTTAGMPTDVSYNALKEGSYLRSLGVGNQSALTDIDRGSGPTNLLPNNSVATNNDGTATYSTPMNNASVGTSNSNQEKMILKNQNIANANPASIANRAYIDALYKEKEGRYATDAEYNRFKANTVKDAANIILGQSLSPFTNASTNQSTTNTQTTQTSTTINNNSTTINNQESSNSVDALYQKYFGRNSSEEEMNYWKNQPLNLLETQLSNDYTNSSGKAYNGVALSVNGDELINQMIQLDPYLQTYFQDPKNKESFGLLDSNQQTYMLQVIGAKQKLIESGKIVNPDVTLEPSKMAEFLETAKSMIDPYYAEQIGNFGEDLKISLQRQQEDYNKSIGRAETTFKDSLNTQAESEAQSGLTYGSERGVRLGKTVTNQNNALEDASIANQRNIQDIGTTAERKIGSSALNSLGLSYNTPSFQASESGFSNTGSRSLFTPKGNLTGELPTQRTVDELNKQTQLANAENVRRTADYNFKKDAIYA